MSVSMQLTVSPRVVAALLVRLAEPRLTPVAKAARRHERTLRRLFLREVRKAQAAVPMRDLEEALKVPGTGAAVYVMQPVFDMLLEETQIRKHETYVRHASRIRYASDATVTTVLSDALTDGANATELCVPESGVAETLVDPIEHINALVNTAVDEAKFTVTEEITDEEDYSFNDLSGNQQETTHAKWIDDQLNEGIEVDDSELIDDLKDDLRRDNDDIIKDTERTVLDELSDAFQDTEATLPLDETFTLYHRLDRDTLVYFDDEGDGATLDLDELRFVDGSKLTDAQKQAVENTWNDAYAEHFDKAFEDVMESDVYWEGRNELEEQALSEMWSNLSDSKKVQLAVEYDVAAYEDFQQTRESSVPAERPTKWETGLDPHRTSDTSYEQTRVIAQKLVELRTEELYNERNIFRSTTNNPQRLISDVWENWKGSSSSDMGKALQLAAAEELGGVHRFEKAEELKIIDAVGGNTRFDALKAYVRAQWETTQFLLKQANTDFVETYRAVMLPGDVIEATPRLELKETKVPFYKLPNLMLQRAGAQSTTTVPSVANNWNGVGNLPSHPERVVLRLRVPHTSVLSLPVYGKNEQSEHEVVVFGARDKWTWDAWLRRAPTFEEIPIQQQQVQH